MITISDLKYFYQKYIENLDKENELLESLNKSNNEEEWIYKIQDKYNVTRRLYIENESLLDTYIRPFLQGRVQLSKQIADYFCEEIIDMDFKGYFDDVSMREVCNLLLTYFKENGSIENYIATLNLLGKFYNIAYSKEDGIKAVECFETICNFSNRYFEIEGFSTRKRIIHAFYNKAIVKSNFSLAEIDELRKECDDAISFYNKVKELDGDKYDFDELIKELEYDVYGGYVLGKNKDEISKEALKEARDILYFYYQEALKDNPDIYAMPDEIYCNYFRCLFFLDEISCDEFIDKEVSFCEYSLQNDSYKDEDGFLNSRLFQVITRQIPAIIENLNIYGKDYHGDKNLRKHYINRYIELIKQLPKASSSSFVNDVIGRSLFNFMELIVSGEGDYNTLLKIAVSRDEITMIHSRIVKEVSIKIINKVIEEKPQLLIGLLDCNNTVEVLEKQNDIQSYLAQACLLFDIGKIQMADIVTKQTRQLTQREKDTIKDHPKNGVALIEKISYFDKYHDIILGHHKSYDGTLGYPEDFDNTKSPYCFFIDLIHLADCICACTDFIGRSYHKPKNFIECLKELSFGKGTFYNTDLVELIEVNIDLQENIEKIISVGRINAYYEAYGVTLKRHDDENSDFYNKVSLINDEKDRLINELYENNKENNDFVKALVRQSLLTIYIDLYDGNYRVISKGNKKLFPDLNDGYYQDFLRLYLSNTFLEKDKESLRYRFSLAELSHILASTDNNYEFEIQMLINNEYKWVRVQCLKLDEEYKVPRKMAMIFSDVSAIHFKNDQMENALKDAYTAAINANNSKSSFLSNMSHDIRTPMNAIVNLARLMKCELDKPEILSDHLDKILQSSNVLLSIINDVLDMSKIESGKAVLTLEDVNLSLLFKQIDDIIRPQTLEKKQIFNMNINNIQYDHVQTDGTRLYQLLSNILTNAIKYTNEYGQIDFDITGLAPSNKNRERIEFKIKDNGIGISKDYLDKIFEPFSRQNSSVTNKIQGTGLGMAITKNIVDMMGGSIDIESTPKVGSTFTVVLEFPIIFDSNNIQESYEVRDNEPILKGLHFLCAEDNKINGEVLKLLLNNVGATCDLYEDGLQVKEAFENSEVGKYDAILMDIQMPIMNGYEATKEIRNCNHKEAKTILIIAMSANAFSEDIQNALNCGMNAHLAKPLDIKKLENIIRTLR